MTFERELHLPTGDQVTFLSTGEETGGALLEFEAVVPPRSSGPPAHLHLHEQEQFTIVQGRLDVRLGTHWAVAGPGEQVTVPPGTKHAFANRGDDPTRIVVRMTPSGNLEQLLRILAASKRPSLLRVAEVNHGENATFFLAGVPVLPQRLLFNGLALVARLRRPG